MIAASSSAGSVLRRLPAVPAWVCVLTPLAVSIAALAGGSPELHVILPRGAKRGGEAMVEFRGARLEQALDVMSTDPGISLTGVEQIDGNRVKATLRISADCPIGLHPLRIRTAHGVTNTELFSVGTLAEATEAEPNNIAAQAQPLTLPITVNGVVTTEDVDAFSFEARAGEQIAVEVEGLRLGGTLFDPHLSILDSSGRILATEDDTTLTRQDPCVLFTAPADGKYVAAVRETAYGGNGDCHYRLHIGSFPRPLAALPAGGQVGAEIALRWLGDPSIGEQAVKLPDVFGPAESAQQTSFSILPRRGDANAPSPVPIFVCSHPSIVEAEPNDNDDQANPIGVPSGAGGVIDRQRDVDRYVFEGKQGQVLEVAVHARRLRSPLDPLIAVHAPGGAHVASNDDSGGPDSVVRFTCPADGKYVVIVRDLLFAHGPAHSYFLEVAPPRASIRLTLLPKEANVAVPAGNRAAILVTAERRDFGGKLNLTAAGLPEGLTAHADTIRESVGQAPVVFEAPPDAKPAGALVDLVGRHVDPNAGIEGGLRQALELVKFEDRPFYTVDVDRLALAVTEAVPFKLHVVEPAVPIVRNGTMALPVRLERAPDFKGDVNIRILWNPPGVGSGTLNLTGVETEGTIHLNANGGAFLGVWRMAAVATGQIGGGNVELSSQLFALRVAEPMVEFAIERSRTELGKPVDVAVKVNTRTPFEGEASVELLGLPPKVATQATVIKADSKEIRYPLAVDAAAPAGRHGGLFVRAVVMKEGQPIVHHSPAGELILDAPLPPPDPAAGAARAEVKRKVAEEKERRRAERLAAAEKRRAEREAKQQAAQQPTEARP